TDDVLDEGDVFLDQLGFRRASRPEFARGGPVPVGLLGAAVGRAQGGGALRGALAPKWRRRAVFCRALARCPACPRGSANVASSLRDHNVQSVARACSWISRSGGPSFHVQNRVLFLTAGGQLAEALP